ncbi:MAG: hypothetical protein HY059_10170 [Proteobacteria bacterium]|nr:hypothetical protein [Pseudomonadota bacterium]
MNNAWIAASLLVLAVSVRAESPVAAPADASAAVEIGFEDRLNATQTPVEPAVVTPDVQTPELIPVGIKDCHCRSGERGRSEKWCKYTGSQNWNYHFVKSYPSWSDCTSDL